MTHNHLLKLRTSLEEGALVCLTVAVVCSCVERFHVSLGNAEGFGSFGSEEDVIVFRKSLRVKFARSRTYVRAVNKPDATIIAVEQQQRRNNFGAFLGLLLPPP